MPVLGLAITGEVVIIGAITGLAYALLAAGLVLVYRGSRVINFAHGEVGAVAAVLLAKLVLQFHWNFAAALVVATLVGAATGAIIELGVVRRLFKAPRLVLLVATIGVSQLLFLVQLLIPSTGTTQGFPTPIDRQWQVGTLLLQGEHFTVLAVVPAIMVVLGVFLTRTPWGIAIRASAENADAAELAAISPKRVSTMVWVLAGALAAITVVLINPLRGTLTGIPGEALGPGLLIRALAAALIGRLVSIPRALVGGIAVGVLEALLVANVASPGFGDAVLFAIVLGALLIRHRDLPGEDTMNFARIPRPTQMPAVLRDHWIERRGRSIAMGGVAVVAVTLPFVFGRPDQVFQLSRMLIYAIAAISLTVLVGWAGQLSLGHFAFVGLGSVVVGALVARGLGFWPAVGYAVVAGMLAGLVVGAPALRLRGLFLSVTTLAFAGAASGWLFPLKIFRGQGSAITAARPRLFGLDMTSQRAWYFLSLVALVVVAAAVTHLRQTGMGRAIIAVRDNEARSASLTLSPAFVKLLAFGFSAALAALAGALLAGLRVQFSPDAFAPRLSLELVAIVIIGGIGRVPGALLGTLWVIGLPAFLGSGIEVTLLTSGVGLLALVMYLPGGLLDAWYRLRGILLDAVARRVSATQVTVDDVTATTAPAGAAVAVAQVVSRTAAPRELDEPVIVVEHLDLDIAGRRILDGVSVRVEQGETVGLIGSNGAGKSTLMNALSGFLAPSGGTARALGHDVTRLSAHDRARLGIGRIFQDARLFADLTVTETILVALEARERSEFLPSLLGLPPSRRAERAKRAEAAAIVDFMGLGRYADHVISSLSTGSRRIVELACLVAQRAELLLLDEPTAGVAQREAEAFGPLVTTIRDELGASVMMIEHDIPLLSGMSDRMYCMSAGRVIAEGLPDQVRTDPAVIAAYLGTDSRAIDRSDTAGADRPLAAVADEPLAAASRVAP